MFKRHFLAILLMLSLTFSTFAEELGVCSRSAQINYQDVIIDTSTTKKGEGLRFYLEKDEEAKRLLDDYQDAIRPKWYNAAIGTVGTGLIILGIGKSGKIVGGEETKQVKEKRALIIGGLAVLLINYLAIKTIEHTNEKLLLRSIEEYNKRNLPKIYFSPTGEKWNDTMGPQINFNLIKARPSFGGQLGFVIDF